MSKEKKMFKDTPVPLAKIPTKDMEPMRMVNKLNQLIKKIKEKGVYNRE